MLCLTAGNNAFRLKTPFANLPESLGFTQTAFDIRKLPQTCQQTVSGALSDGIAVSAAKKKDGFLFDPPGGGCRTDRVRKLILRKMGKTESAKGTAFAAGSGVRQTDSFSELHDAFCQQTGVTAGGIETAQKSGEFLPYSGLENVIRAGKKPGQYAHDVAVHGGFGKPEGNGSNGTGGIIADAGQSA